MVGEKTIENYLNELVFIVNMKKVLMILFLLICLNVAMAGEVHRVNLEGELVHILQVPEGDVVRFNWEGKDHKIMVKKVMNDGASVTTFIEGSEVPYYAKINFANSMNLDFDKDGLHDLSVRVNEINGKSVSLALERLNVEGNLITGNVVGASGTSSFGVFVTVLVLVAIVVLGIVWKRKR